MKTQRLLAVCALLTIMAAGCAASNSRQTPSVKEGTLIFYSGETAVEDGRSSSFSGLLEAGGERSMVEIFRRLVVKQEEELGRVVNLNAFNVVGQ